jgi:lipoprotein-anchoring transpeptidase ErfK/SrfK
MKMPSILLRIATVSAIVASLPSCNTTQAGQAQTQYLDAFNPASVPGTDNSAVDTVSYWDGDHMSGPTRVVLDLSEQKAYFYKGDTLAGVSLICSGNETHRTKTGNFKIFEKDLNHKSNLYGDFVDAGGNVVVKDVDITKDKCPPGAHFDGSRMHWFMRFNEGAGMHEGFMAGYPASHGCVRMPTKMADIFFHNVSVGTPVRVQE